MASMDNWGVTKTGFYRPTVDDIIAEKNKKAKEIFGDDFDTSEQTPQGKFFRINAVAESKLCEIAEQIYYSIFPATATGISLDRLAYGVNLQRDNAEYAVHIIRVYGTENHIISAGTTFKNASDIEFYCSADYTINQPEYNPQTEETVYYADVTVYCSESGTVGNVDNIYDTVEVDTDITGISYVSIVTYGEDIENDVDLRAKYNTVIQGLGSNTDVAIKANVLRVSGVNDVITINNPTTETVVISDTLTIQPKSYAVIVYADDTSNKEEIANAIFEKMPLGVSQSGVESVKIKDNSYTEQTIKFTYVSPKTLDIVVKCDIDSTFETEGIQQIKDSINNYINNLGIGKEVVFSQLYASIYSVIGVHKVTELTINGGTDDIAVSRIEIAKVGSINVTVSEV